MYSKTADLQSSEKRDNFPLANLEQMGEEPGGCLNNLEAPINIFIPLTPQSRQVLHLLYYTEYGRYFDI